MKKCNFLKYLKGLNVEKMNIYQCLIKELVEKLGGQKEVAIQMTKESGKKYDETYISKYIKGGGFTTDTMMTIQKVAGNKLDMKRTLRAMLKAVESTEEK